jgi:hypothetical protein
MVSNFDESRSGDRENLPLESFITLQYFSEDLAYITECLQGLRELQELVSTCSGFLVEDGLSHDLSIRHIYLLLDIYVCNSAQLWDEIRATVARLQRTVEERAVNS